MSLVAYVASDDSDGGSDSENENVDDKSLTPNPNISNQSEDNKGGDISDEDDYQTVSSTSAISSTLLYDDPLTLRSQAIINSTSVTSLEDLPAPQAKKTEVLQEDELEDEVKPKANEIASAPKPPGKKKQTVKITIPSLYETPDDEEDKPKALAPSVKKSGLFSMLPAPLHSAKKEINRPLIPHTLTRKPAPPKNSGKPSSSQAASKSVQSEEKASTKRMTPFNALTGYDSDSDDEDNGNSSNFFSLAASDKSIGETSSEAKKSASSDFFSLDASQSDRIPKSGSSNKLQIGEVSSSGSDIKSSTSQVPNYEASTVESSSKSEEVEEKELTIQGPEPGAVNDAPLDFGNVRGIGSWPGSSYGYLGPVGPTGPVVNPHYYSSVPSSAQYNLAHEEDPHNEVTDDVVGDEDLKKFMSDKEFQKLSGKRKRGLEDNISFVDANVDDYVDPSEVSKYMTEESEYVSHKSKDNLPTAQQRRKKQITYLAYQAKEREMELKNSWAQNRMTKKQTQSKYGF